MIVGAYIVLGLVCIVFVIGSIRQRKLLFNKAMFFLTVIALGVLFISGRFSSNHVEMPKYQVNMPPPNVAPYEALTRNRAYFVVSSKTGEDGYPVLTSYYEYNKKKWELSYKELPLDPLVFGDVKITKRAGVGQ